MSSAKFKTTRPLRSATEEPVDWLEPVPALFCVLQGSRPTEPPTRHILATVQEVNIGRTDAQHYVYTTLPDDEERFTLDIRVPDPCMSSKHARLTWSERGLLFEDLASRNGSRINGVPRKSALLADDDVIELGQTFFIFRAALNTHGDGRTHARATWSRDDQQEGELPIGLRTLLPSLTHQFERLRRFAESSVSIVVLGESGTGKDVMAQAIHALASSARRGAFVPVNCGAIPENLVESELFGHVEGAFTGAKGKQGLVQNADDGTLFLDEIGDMPLPAQVALLRVLQDRKVRQVGGNTTRDVDFRVVAATHQPIDQMVEDGRFREDLWSRLSEFKLALPPLRERREDLGIFVADILRNLLPGDMQRVTLDPEVGRALLSYRWPRNVRELVKCLKTALVLAKNREILLEHLPREVRAPDPENEYRRESAAPATREDKEVQRKAELISLLAQENGNVSAVARKMGKARNQVQRWIQRFGINLERYRP